MRLLDVSAVTGSTGVPLKSGSLTHLQLAYQEIVNASVTAIIGSNYNASKVYILFGCQNTGSGLNYLISAGAVFYNGTVYLVAGTSFTASAGQVAVGTVTLSFYSGTNADPVTFTDTIPRNIHQNYTMVFAAAAAGSGTSDFSLMLKGNSAQLPLGAVIDYFPASNTLAEFDTTGKGIAYNTFGWAVCNGNNATKNLAGAFLVGYNAGDVDYALIGNTGGAKSRTLSTGNIPPHYHSLPVGTSGTAGPGFVPQINGPYNSGSPLNTGNGSTGGESSLSGTPFDVRPPFVTSLKIQRIY